MPRRSNSFQRLVAFLEAQLAPAGATVSESVLLQPTDGTQPREVDVLIEATLGPRSIRVGIECRDHSRKAGVQWIDELVGRYQHLPVERIVAVARAGFTRDAQKAAKHHHIELVTLEEALRGDWVERVSCYKAAVISWTHSFQTARIAFHGGTRPPMDSEQLRVAPIVDREGKHLGTLADDVMFLFRSNVPGDAKQFLDANAAELLKAAVPQTVSIDCLYNATNRYLVGADGRRWEIKSIVLVVTLESTVEASDLRHFSYHGAKFGMAELRPRGSPHTVDLTLLFDERGDPKALHVQQGVERRTKS